MKNNEQHENELLSTLRTNVRGLNEKRIYNRALKSDIAKDARYLLVKALENYRAAHTANEHCEAVNSKLEHSRMLCAQEAGSAKAWEEAAELAERQLEAANRVVQSLTKENNKLEKRLAEKQSLLERADSVNGKTIKENKALWDELRQERRDYGRLFWVSVAGCLIMLALYIYGILFV